MADIKPAEVSEILKKQLEGFKTTEELEEVGTVLQVGDGIARIYGLTNVQSNELIEFEDGSMGMVLNLEEDNVAAVLFGSSEEISEGDLVKRTGNIASLNVGEGMLGRVINTLGEPLDGKGPIKGETYVMPLERKAPGVIYRQPVSEPLQTGIKALTKLGFTTYQAYRAARIFKHYDSEVMSELFEHYQEDEKKYLSESKRIANELEELLQTEKERALHVEDSAWDVTTLREEVREVYAEMDKGGNEE